MSASRLDAVYRSILLTKFFTKGWGKPENLRRLFEFRKVVSNREECFKLVERDYPVTITKEQTLSDCRLLEGYFTSPLERCLPGIVPEVAQRAHFQVVLPVHWPQPGCKPVCLHLAGTGDHFFWRRRNLMIKPLLKEAGIGGIILENPFYGLRKPTDQVRSSLHNVSDIFVMGGCLILEALVLFHWCERHGLGPLGVTGLSMGGHMASLAATNWPKPLVLVPCLSWSTASAVFLQGVMSQSINWDLLEDQYLSDGEYKDKLAKMVTIVDEAFLAGQKFARTYTHTDETNAQKQNLIAAQTNKPHNLDITYKEAVMVTQNSAGKSTTITGESIQENVPKDSLEPIMKLNEELKTLLEENKISRLLYDKLTSNEKFELEAEDIECINKLNKTSLKELLLKCKVAQIRNDAFRPPPPNNHPVPPLKHESRAIYDNSTTISKQQHTLQQTAIDLKATELNATATELKATATELQSTATKLQATATELTTTTTEIVSNSTDSKAVASIVAQTTVIKSTPATDKSEKKPWSYIPFLKSNVKKIDISKIHWRDREALQFMRGIMDECTHLSNFSVPFDTSLIIAVCAKHDAYVPRDDVGTLEEIWPGAEVRYVAAGHVSAYILHQSMFRSCIKEAFERSKNKWKDGKHVD